MRSIRRPYSGGPSRAVGDKEQHRTATSDLLAQTRVGDRLFGLLGPSESLVRPAETEPKDVDVLQGQPGELGIVAGQGGHRSQLPLRL
jgi:hypothetical protein